MNEITPDSILSDYLGTVMDEPGVIWYMGDHTENSTYGPSKWVVSCEGPVRSALAKHGEITCVGRNLYRASGVTTLLFQFTPHGVEPHNEPPAGRQWKK